MGKLKILQLCSARQYVGEAARVVDLSEKFRELGHSVEVIVREKFSVAEQCSRRGIPFTSINLRSRCNPFIDAKDIKILRSRIRDFQPDIVHAHRGKEHWLAAAALMGMRGAIPLIRTRHVVTKVKPHLANKWLFGKATCGLIYVSEAVADEVAKINHFIKCKTRVITGGINENRFLIPRDESVAEYRKFLNIPESVAVVSCLARLAPVKGQEYIIRAIPEVVKKSENVLFLFSYPRQSDYRQLLDNLVRELKVERHVRFLGPVDNLGVFFKVSDMGILSSIDSEGWSRATVEFMYYGVPVIATDVGCLSEIIENGRNGFLIKRKDSSAIAGAVNSLVEDLPKAKEMGEYARTQVLEKHTLNNTAGKVLGFYEEVLRERK